MKDAIGKYPTKKGNVWRLEESNLRKTKQKPKTKKKAKEVKKTLKKKYGKLLT